MSADDHASSFVGSIPDAYDMFLVPLLFEPYARELVARLGHVVSGDLLELAAGTGAVTRELALTLPASVQIVATDLNQPMLDQAASREIARPVEWQQADAQQLPFADASFDVAVCQFGVMFFPDRRGAYAEVMRVLRPGGRFLFDVWTSVADNELGGLASSTVAAMFPDDPPRFVERVPHGYHDPAQITADLRAGGFAGSITIDVVDQRSRAATCRQVAQGFCLGTPIRNEIMARDPGRLDEAVELVTAAVSARWGEIDIDAKMQALVVTAHP
ncbi:MAG: class I SAM-dependent methyltransferase [Ilumatobacteraceae bacterium]